MHVKPAYIAASCNKASHVSACRLRDGLVLYGSGRFIAEWDTEEPTKPLRTYPGHTATVTALKLVDPLRFVSADEDGGILLWENDVSGWHVAQTISAGASVSSLGTLPLADGGILIVAGMADGSLGVWHDATCIQTLSLRSRRIALDLALAELPGGGIALAVGSTQPALLLYTCGADLQFGLELTLAGHSDWIRCVDFLAPSVRAEEYDIGPGELLLASGGQDNYIRLWRVGGGEQRSSERAGERSEEQGEAITPDKDDILSQNGASPAQDAAQESLSSLDPLDATTDDFGEIRVKARRFRAASREFYISSESVLLGHDFWVTGLHWAPLNAGNPRLRLLSCSADRSMIVWTPSWGASEDSTIWTVAARFGEFSSATNLGFFGGLWGTGANAVLSSGWGGSWHGWGLPQAERKQEVESQGGSGPSHPVEASDTPELSSSTGFSSPSSPQSSIALPAFSTQTWEPMVSVSGHSDVAKNVAWEPQGDYFLSTGLDRTTRIHAKWMANGTWHEVARPQIHGYTLTAAYFVDRLRIVSGADEKIIRVLEAPQAFIRRIGELSGVKFSEEETHKDGRALSAAVPPLGLSNRAINGEGEATEEAAKADNTDPRTRTSPLPPFEEELLGSTLWYETTKVYGHAFETVSIATAPLSHLVAATCKATRPEYAAIRLYDSETWLPHGAELEGHALTVTKVKFSPHEEYLLSVSRDRSWIVYAKTADGFVLHQKMEKAHARIVWDCAWASTNDFFVTVSRDKTCKTWHADHGRFACSSVLTLDSAATAVDLVHFNGTNVLCVGLESGHLLMYTSTNGLDWEKCAELDSFTAHTQTVTCIAFRPLSQDHPTLAVATCSEDRTVKLFELAMDGR